MHDLLSQSLDDLKLQSAAYRRLEQAGAWAFEFSPGIRGIHVVERGRCVLEVDGRAAEVLERFDYVVVPHGVAHRMRAADELPTTLACGAFTFGAAEDHPVLAALPAVLRVKGGRPASRVGAHVGSLLVELAEPEEGSAVVVARLSDVLLVHAIREFAASTCSEASTGWFASLRHPQLRAALALLHAAPEEPWTVDALAGRVGMSRASFAMHFRRSMGEPPLEYLTRWRMFQARRLLRESSLSLKEIAARCGYGSATALSAVFTRRVGSSPGAWRAQASQAPSRLPPPEP